MDMPTWAGFVLSSAILLVIPGPTVAIVVASVLRGGAPVVTPLAAGVVLGHLTAMTLSMLGVGAVLAASEIAFMGLRLVGAAYLIWLGVVLWYPVGRLAGPMRRPGAWRPGVVGQVWLVTALNPLSIMFFVAFVPQFVDPGRAILTQIVVLEGTFLALAFANALAYGFLTARTAGRAGAPGFARWLRSLAGAVLVGTGTWTLAFAA